MGYRFQVTYASAGCLPDNDSPETFDTLTEAREYIMWEWSSVAFELPEWTDNGTTGTVPSKASLDAIDAILKMEAGSGADDPRPGSQYRWTLTAICPQCGSENVTPAKGYRLPRCNSCGIAFDTMTDEDGN